MKILKFLVIEDDALLRDVLCGALREALREREREAIIFEASDRSEATRIVKQHGHIDLILLDLELPDTDGFEFLRELEALLFPGRLGPGSPFLPLDLTLSWYPTVSIVVMSGCRREYGWNLFGAISGTTKLSDQAARSTS
jgi:CheY-like chemotaxis protein